MPYFSLSRDSEPSRFVKLILFVVVVVVVVVVYFSFNAQKVEILIEIQIHMHLNFIDPKIKISRDFRVFVLSPIPKNENSEVTEILQKLNLRM